MLHASDDVAKIIFELLQGFHLPSVAVYVEIFVVQFVRKFPQHLGLLLLDNLKDYGMRAANAKVILGAAFVLVQQGWVTDKDKERMVVQSCLPFINAVQHPVRSRVAFICDLWSKNKNLMQHLDQGTRYCLEMVSSYVENCGDLSRKIAKSEDNWLTEYISKVKHGLSFFYTPKRL